MYKDDIKCNVSVMFDASHDAYRAVMEAIRESRLMAFVLLVMICINLPNRPGDTDMRFVQMQDAAKALFQVHKPQSMVLFQEYLRDMLKEAE